jgi:hypothetical protein
VLGQGNIGGGLLDIRYEEHQKSLYRLTTTRLRKNNIDTLGRTSKEARAMDSWRQSPARDREKSILGSEVEEPK